MEQSEKAKQFLASLDPQALKVGDGSDGLPVWIGIDAEAGKVYKVYASGQATGFGDGCMQIRSGVDKADQRFVGQLTIGKHVMLLTGAKGVGLASIMVELHDQAT